MRTIATKVDNELAERFSKYCDEKGCTPSDELRSLMKNTLDASEARTSSGAKKPNPKVMVLVERDNNRRKS